MTVIGRFYCECGEELQLSFMERAHGICCTECGHYINLFHQIRVAQEALRHELRVLELENDHITGAQE